MIGVEKKSIPQLQEERTVRKVCLLDDHVVMAFSGDAYNIVNIVCLSFHLLTSGSGLTADARVLSNKAKQECQVYKLTMEDIVTVGYITRFIATMKQVNENFKSLKPLL